MMLTSFTGYERECTHIAESGPCHGRYILQLGALGFRVYYLRLRRVCGYRQQLPGNWLIGLLTGRHLRSLVFASLAACATVAFGLGMAVAGNTTHAFVHHTWLLYPSIAL